ncbi:BatA domain-containing protein [Lysobacter antibioticus]|uniref:BatA domain-containing protein n=1 Tax=Lysobacter antibioticus TaxID=84531 RepID=UPI000349BF43|nr:BatA domain-containing protein [Lysobacter antibioticus]
MSLALLLPLGLAALAAWLLPMLIHLARRSEQRPTDFAALRWLRHRPKPRHRLRFEDWPLLLLRLLLLALLALWLARPVLSGAEGDRPWIALAAGADPSAARAAAAAHDAELRWLAPGFPAVADGASAPPAEARAVPAGSLLRELDALLPAQTRLTVFVPERLHGLDAQRLQLSRRVEWEIVAGGASQPPATPDATVPPPALRYVAERTPDARYIRAALSAWETGSAGPHRPADIATASTPPRSDANGLIWLAPGAVPAAVLDKARNGAIVLLDAQAQWPRGVGTRRTAAWRDRSGAVLAEGVHYGRGRLLRLTRPLAPAQLPELLEPGFVAALRAMFQPLPPAPALALARDIAPRTGAVAAALPPQDLRPWLAVAIALAALLERWLATRARGGSGP